MMGTSRLMSSSSRHALEGLRKLESTEVGGQRQDEYMAQLVMGNETKTIHLRADGMDLTLLTQAHGEFKPTIKFDGLMASGIILNAMKNRLDGYYWSYVGTEPVAGEAGRYEIKVRINRHLDSKEKSEYITARYTLNPDGTIAIDMENGRPLVWNRDKFFLETLSHPIVKNQLMSYLWEQVDVTERDLISPLGVSLRDTRWLPGDLQMLKFGLPYKEYMAPRDQYHMGGLNRRFTLDVMFGMWIAVFTILNLSGWVSLENIDMATNMYIISLAIIIGIDKVLSPVAFFYNQLKMLKVPGQTLARKWIDAMKFAWDVANKLIVNTFYGTLTSMPNLVSRPAEGKLVKSMDAMGLKIEWGGLANSALAILERDSFPLLRSEVRDGKVVQSYASAGKNAIIIGLALLAGLVVLGYVGMILTPTLYLGIGIFITSFTTGFYFKWLSGLPGKKPFQEGA